MNKTGRTPVEDLDSSSTFGEMHMTEGVFCQAEAWRAACLATSATAMVRNLLLGTFDLETLLKSNLNGTKQHVPNLFCP
ncbi:hypothetical protein ROHU_001887 [Labeo rohita]|uniref:Uncharacterized protein n=1 Tax=Labeo rohita TaxID=84645 RepID=A0A498P234_LABRO|nr:hypothetical protein ROHU_001887 [Labeo rohita]